MYNDLKPNKSMFGLALSWLLFGVTVLIAILLLSYFLGWFAKPLEVMSPDNIERLSRQANEAWQALEAKEASIEQVESKANLMITAYGEDMKVWPQGKRDEYLQLQAQVTNLTTSFNAQCGQYNALWSDEWRGIPAPDDLPTRCKMR